MARVKHVTQDKEAKLKTLLGPKLSRARERSGRLAFAQGAVLAREASYDFPQLAAWRDQAVGPVLDVPGVSFVDANEQENRLDVGIHDDAARVRVDAKLAELGIPREGVIFTRVTMTALAAGSPFSSGAAEVSFTSTTDPCANNPNITNGVSIDKFGCFRPVPGGVAFGWYTQTAARWCTIGFNAIYNSRPVFVTNSHCTQTWGTLDYAHYTQPYQQGDQYVVGREVADPVYGDACGSFWSYKCRNSDAAVIEYNRCGVSAFPCVAHELGYIARTTGLQRRAPGSRTISTSMPRFRIVGKFIYDYPRSGHFVDKMGAATGWTFGAITRTCTDRVQQGKLRLYCQDQADMYAEDGDSGSPVFKLINDPEVGLVGMAWGIEDINGVRHTWLSSIKRIQDDLGALDVGSPVVF